MVLLSLSTYGTYSNPGASDLLTLQQVRISGTITDSNTGEPLAGVNIVVEGTTIGTSTDINGKYSLNVPNLTGTLQMTYIGYVTQKISISGRTTIDVSLVSDIQALSCSKPQRHPADDLYRLCYAENSHKWKNNN